MTPKDLSPGCVLHFNGKFAKHITLILSYSLKENNKCMHYFALEASSRNNKLSYMKCNIHSFLPTIVLEETHDTVLIP